MKNLFFSKTTNYLILGITVIAMVLGSCKKEDVEDDEGEGDGNGYKITFKVDNVLKVFEDEYFPPFGYIYENGTANFGDTGSSNSISFVVYDTKPIQEKEYKGYVITETSQGKTLVGATISYSEGKLGYTTLGLENPNVRVKITEITETSVRGEFSGTLQSADKKTEIKITEGKFYVERRSAVAI